MRHIQSNCKEELFIDKKGDALSKVLQIYEKRRQM
jgi:hypothetical protein